MKMVFILSDALRHDYLQYMPFLQAMTEECPYYKKVIPGLGFCEISEYVSGRTSLDTGNTFQVTFSGKFGKTHLHDLTMANKIVNKIPRVRRYSARLLDRYLQKYDGSLFEHDMLRVRYNIPLSMLSFFIPTESKLKYDAPEFFPATNLFHILQKAGLSYDIQDFVEHNKIKGTDDERLARLRTKIEAKNLKDFTLLYIGFGEIAHATGTRSASFHSKLTSYDGTLKNLYTLLKKNYGEDFRFVILGDHGMVDVEKYIDITELIEQMKDKFHLTVGEDFVYFIDSTAFRVWLRDQRFLSECNAMIQERLATDLDELDLERADNFYGDLIYILRPGRVFFPDFFNVYKNKGMHGYTNKIDEQKGMCLILGDQRHAVHEELELHCAHQLILEQFGLSFA